MDASAHREMQREEGLKNLALLPLTRENGKGKADR
jgi:hypothetical protein